MYGGYSDIGDSDEHEDEDILGLPKTKDGYVKDDFVVSSDAEDEDDAGSDEEEEIVESDEEFKPKKKKPVAKKVVVEKKPKKPKLKEPVYIEMTEELTEDVYLE